MAYYYIFTSYKYRLQYIVIIKKIQMNPKSVVLP